MSNQRELKFRGKRIDMDRWVYGDYFKTPLTDENSKTDSKVGWFFLTGVTRHCIGNNCSAFVVDPESVGLGTGLKDKNGTEMFEGDIVSAHGTLGVVEWCKDLSLFTLKVKVDGEIGDMTIYSHQENGRNVHREIKGNIYQHPTLLP